MKFFMNWKTDKRGSINLNFIFSSGRPITGPVANYNVQDVIIPHFSERNELRIPNYHRLDFAYTFRLSRRSNVKYKSFFTFSIYNLYARRNAFSIFYGQNLNSIVNASKLSIVGSAFPGANISVQF